MSELKITGVIIEILDTQKGTSKKGKEWISKEFIIDNNEQYNNLFCFKLFGEEKVTNFEKYNKIGGCVDVSFNIKTRKWNDKYFTNLEAWKVFNAKSNESEPNVNSKSTESQPNVNEESNNFEPIGDDDLPF